MSAEELALMGFIFPVTWAATRSKFHVVSALLAKREFVMVDWDDDVAFPVFEVVRCEDSNIEGF